MPKAIRKFPVMGTETIQTAAGVLTFLNGEADVTDAQAQELEGISDIRVKQDVAKKQESSAPDEAEIARLEADKKRLADEAEILRVAGEAETQRLTEEQAKTEEVKAPERAPTEEAKPEEVKAGATTTAGPKKPLPPALTK